MPVYSGMDTFFVDFETFYSNEYTLQKMDPPSYILHPLFEATCLGVAKNTDPPYLVDGPDIPQFFHDLPRDVAVVTHNALFDMCIASWRFGYVPKLIIDTLAMSRTLLAHKLKSVSLKSVAKHLGLPEKGSFLANARGMTRLDLLANNMWQDYTDYCLHDVELCRMIFLELAPKLPAEEFIIHDMVTRCAVEPLFRLDTEILAEHLDAVRVEKEEMLGKAMDAGAVSKDVLMSNPKFADLLRSLGVDPPMKISLATDELTYAFSRQDIEFMELLNHEDPRVQAVMAARLGFKSTLEETRTERMLNIANLDFPHHGGDHVMPIPLKIGAAITHRLGGDWQLNCQNWGRQSPIRQSVLAPEGWSVVASDAAQIEARMNAWFCGQWDLVEQFARGEDVYATFASYVYGYTVNKIEHPGPRFVGKTSILQLGYQSGWRKLQKQVFLLSTKDGMPIELTDFESERTVTGYRTRMNCINNMWDRLSGLIQWMATADDDQTHVIGPVRFYRNRAVGPNGLTLYYDNLNYDHIARQWTYSYAGNTYQIFGGKFLENIIQFLARVAIMQAALRVRKRLANLTVRMAHQAHDELIYLCPDPLAETVAAILTEEMSRTPEWAPHLPLVGETKIGKSYGSMRMSLL
jgi:hypothetical protein